MGGEVGVESELGAGSTFWFTVALRPTSATAVRSETTTSARTAMGAAGPWRVLVVDDNPVNQLVSAKIFQKFNCRVDMVANGAEAVDAVKTLPFDLVLMDCQMPVMDGCEATVAIRQLDGVQGRVPIVALTASALPSERDRCLEAGMDDYVAKPATVEQLARVVSRWLVDPASDNAA
jgi:CheY-like chemotaxis protein